MLYMFLLFKHIYIYIYIAIWTHFVYTTARIQYLLASIATCMAKTANGIAKKTACAETKVVTTSFVAALTAV